MSNEEMNQKEMSGYDPTTTVMVCITQCSRALTTREFPLVVMVCNTQCSRALTTREFPLVDQLSSRTNHFTDTLAIGGANKQRSLGVRLDPSTGWCARSVMTVFVQLISQLIQSMVQALIRVCGVDGR